jgi:hypothetical protein
MKLRFFHVESDIVQRADQSRVLAAWKRRKPWDQSIGEQILKLITVVVDRNQHPVHVYLLKLGLQDGWITEQSRRESVEFIVADERWGGGTRKRRAAWIAALKTHLRDLPPDMGTQVATALDIPVWELVKAPLAIGGPLPVSLQMGVSVKELLMYYDPVQAG